MLILPPTVFRVCVEVFVSFVFCFFVFLSFSMRTVRAYTEVEREEDILW